MVVFCESVSTEIFRSEYTTLPYPVWIYKYPEWVSVNQMSDVNLLTWLKCSFFIVTDANLWSIKLACTVKMIVIFTLQNWTVVVANSVTSSAALAIYIIIFLKLISYQQVNRWCRDYFTQADEKSKSFLLRRSRSLSHSHAMTGTSSLIFAIIMQRS